MLRRERLEVVERAADQRVGVEVEHRLPGRACEQVGEQQRLACLAKLIERQHRGEQRQLVDPGGLRAQQLEGLARAVVLGRGVEHQRDDRPRAGVLGSRRREHAGARDLPAANYRRDLHPRTS